MRGLRADRGDAQQVKQPRAGGVEGGVHVAQHGLDGGEEGAGMAIRAVCGGAPCHALAAGQLPGMRSGGTTWAPVPDKSVEPPCRAL